MWAIVGLGNPGRKYVNTRHNAGFLVLENLAGLIRSGVTETELYRYTKGSIKGVQTVLIEPLTFMNLSGLAVKEAMKSYAVEPSHLIVIHDDLDMEPGRLKLKMGGGTGGHKGIASVIGEIDYENFLRVKIGIGRPDGQETESYVLGKFAKSELPAIQEAVHAASNAIICAIREGPVKAMNLFNQKPRDAGADETDGS